MKKRKQICLIANMLIWSAFFIFLILQHNMVWLAYDDYGYVSLSYVVDVGKTGNEYTIIDVIKYLYAHYMQWGGRVLYFFFYR